MSFEREIAKANTKIVEKMGRVFRGTSLDIFGKIILRTPVDTGRLRGNWYASINKPSKQIDSRAEDVDGVVKRAKVTDSLFLTNNLPYVEAIESGTSKQAPAGMVAVTVAAFKQIVNIQARKK